MLKQRLLNVLMASVLVVLGACATGPTQQLLEGADGTGQAGSTEGAAGEGGPDATGLGSDGNLAIDILDEGGKVGAAAASAYRPNTIYFDYNSSEIRDEFLPLIIRMAKTLEDNPRMQARLEGHADERGTREYNLALGERRAQEVRNLVLLQGVGEDQVDIISYGEEKPAMPGTGEASWELNRRVELVF
ncbi:MAG: OmpA family protein [Gammaproteobacteria bacterium]|nr:OmpA family protein [Gammaproteobacteria bacterium]